MLRVYLLILFCSFALLGCKTTLEQQANHLAVDPIYADSAFPYHHHIDIESEEDIFAIDEQMQLLVTELARYKNTDSQVKHLVDFIFSGDQIGINYNASANLTAQETFYSQNANCISLTVLSYALARAAGMTAVFQKVNVPEYWIRNGDYNMLAGHVNVAVIDGYLPLQQTVYGKKKFTIDFDPFVSKKPFPSQFVDKNMIVAMFYTNKGADALVVGNMNKAYAYLKAATMIAPEYDAAWGNLGVLYRQNELYDYAQISYQNAIDLNDNNLTAMGNLSLVYDITGKTAQAEMLREYVHQKRLKNPYYHALMGDEAHYQGDYLTAVKHYKKAIRLDNKQHEFYFGIAKAYAEMGDLDKVKWSLQRARSNAQYNDQQNRYNAKIEFLNTASVRY